MKQNVTGIALRVELFNIWSNHTETNLIKHVKKRGKKNQTNKR